MFFKIKNRERRIFVVNHNSLSEAKRLNPGCNVNCISQAEAKLIDRLRRRRLVRHWKTIIKRGIWNTVEYHRGCTCILGQGLYIKSTERCLNRKMTRHEKTFMGLAYARGWKEAFQYIREHLLKF